MMVAVGDGALGDGALCDGALGDGALGDGALCDGALAWCMAMVVNAKNHVYAVVDTWHHPR